MDTNLLIIGILVGVVIANFRLNNIKKFLAKVKRKRLTVTVQFTHLWAFEMAKQVHDREANQFEFDTSYKVVDFGYNTRNGWKSLDKLKKRVNKLCVDATESELDFIMDVVTIAYELKNNFLYDGKSGGE